MFFRRFFNPVLVRFFPKSLSNFNLSNTISKTSRTEQTACWCFSLLYNKFTTLKT